MLTKIVVSVLKNLRQFLIVSFFDWIRSKILTFHFLVEGTDTFSPNRKSQLKRHERLRIDDKKYYHLLPNQIRAIVDRMIAPITKENKLNFTQFQKFLDLNPALRQIVRNSVKPQLWSINDKSKLVEDMSSN